MRDIVIAILPDFYHQEIWRLTTLVLSKSTQVLHKEEAQISMEAKSPSKAERGEVQLGWKFQTHYVSRCI